VITALRVEWCKARARAMRWSEEVHLLLEEMRRVLQFLDWKAGIWRTRAEPFEVVKYVGSQHRSRAEALRAYALRQARIQEDLHSNFKSLWRVVPSLVISRVGRDPSVVLDLNDHAIKELSSVASFLRT